MYTFRTKTSWFRKSAVPYFSRSAQFEVDPKVSPSEYRIQTQCVCFVIDPIAKSIMDAWLFWCQIKRK